MDKACAQLAEPLATKSVSTTLGSASNAAQELYANSHHHLLLHADLLKLNGRVGTEMVSCMMLCLSGTANIRGQMYIRHRESKQCNSSNIFIALCSALLMKK
jgi:hypothetical protein